MSDLRTIIAIDQGTTSSRAILFDEAGTILAQQSAEFPQHFPADGWVDGMDIFGACWGGRYNIKRLGITFHASTRGVDQGRLICFLRVPAGHSFHVWALDNAECFRFGHFRLSENDEFSGFVISVPSYKLIASVFCISAPSKLMNVSAFRISVFPN